MESKTGVLGWLYRFRLELVLVLVFVGASIPYAIKASSYRSAVVRWRDQHRMLTEGRDVYRLSLYPNPPITGLMLRPFSELSPLAGALVWYYVKVAMVLLVFYWVFRLVETPDRPFPFWAKVLTAALSLRAMVGDLSHGNINIYVLFLVVAALYAFSRGRHWLSGGVLGLAIATKVTPLLFVPYLLWKRAWKSLAGCAVGLVFFTWVVPGMFLGFHENHELLMSWRKQMIDPFLAGGQVAYSEHNNQSLPGLVVRLTTESPSFTTFVGHKLVPLDFHNFIALSPRWADRLFVKTAMLLFVGVIIWSCRTPTTPRQGWRLAAEFGLVLLGMLIFSERTWKHHCVVLVIPYAVLCYYLGACRPGPRLRWYLIATIVAVVFLVASTSTSLAGKELGKLAQVYGAYLWSHVLMVVALIVLLRQPVLPPATGQSPSVF